MENLNWERIIGGALYELFAFAIAILYAGVVGRIARGKGLAQALGIVLFISFFCFSYYVNTEDDDIKSQERILKWTVFVALLGVASIIISRSREGELSDEYKEARHREEARSKPHPNRLF